MSDRAPQLSRFQLNDLEVGSTGSLTQIIRPLMGTTSTDMVFLLNLGFRASVDQCPRWYIAVTVGTDPSHTNFPDNRSCPAFKLRCCVQHERISDLHIGFKCEAIDSRK